MSQQLSRMEGILPALVDEPTSRWDVRGVYVEHGPFIHRTLLRLGVREADVDDALQQVLVVVHRRLADYDASSPITAWLFGIALRVARGQRRRAHLWREVLLRAPQEDLADESTPEQELERLRAQRRLERILDRMSPVKRATFIMFELEGLSCDQIAEVTGVPVGTVYSRLHSARRQFERSLPRVPVEKGARHG